MEPQCCPPTIPSPTRFIKAPLHTQTVTLGRKRELIRIIGAFEKAMWTTGRSHGQGISDWPRSFGSKAQAVSRLSLHGTRTLENSKQQKSQSLKIQHLASTCLFKSRVPIRRARIGNLRHQTRAFETGPSGETTHARLSHQDRVVEPPASKVSHGTPSPFGHSRTPLFDPCHVNVNRFTA